MINPISHADQFKTRTVSELTKGYPRCAYKTYEQTDGYISDQDNLTSCTSSGCVCVLQMCKVSSESV